MTEQQAYEVVQTYDTFELRRYDPCVVAEVVVNAAFADAGNAAFRTLVGYIGGRNRTRSTLAMTAPVLQTESTRMAMTAPVEQREKGVGEYAVAFVLPSSYTVENAPEPTDAGVVLHQRPAVLAAARRYRGRWTQASYERQRAVLEQGLRAAGYAPVGATRWARFNPPITPFFLRRNEVVQEVEAVGFQAAG